MLKNIQLKIDSRIERLYNMTFKGQAEKILKMEEKEKLACIQEIDDIRLALYEHMSGYDKYEMTGGFPRALCSAEEFMFCEAKVKRLEILLNTLLGINDQLDEMDEFEKYAQAQEQFKNHEISEAKYNSKMADLADASRRASVAESIQAQAAALTAKYYKG